MIKLLTIVPSFFLIHFSNAQTIDRNFATNGFMEIYDAKGKSLTAKSDANIEGTPFLNEMCAKGEVWLMNGQGFKEVALKLNLLSGELYFEKGAATYLFTEPVKQFVFSSTNDGQEKKCLFRAGYPEVNNKPAGPFYQVLAEGQHLHLLKSISKKMVHIEKYNTPPVRKYVQAEEIYVYDAGGKRMINLEKNKGSLAQLFPGYATKIEERGKRKKGKSMTEQELISIVNEINNETVKSSK